jgi:alpha-L-fucosidase
MNYLHFSKCKKSLICILRNEMVKIIFPILIVFNPLNISAQHQEYDPDPDPVIQKKLEAWQDLKFGLLMHWGTYSQWGIVESWSICPEDVGWATGGRKPSVADNYNDYVKKYTNLKTTFNPVNFNPQKWADAAKEAGMKYMVFTTKHHDGFCMFDTKYTDYRITDKDCPFSKDPRSNITKEVFDAFRKDNFWIGAYFSKPDWHSDYYWWKKFPASDRNCNYSIQKHPDQWKKFVDYTHNQINELMSDYGKVDILWLDGGWVRKKTDEEVKNELSDTTDGSRYLRNPQSQDIDMPRLVKEARSKQPGVIVVDRAVPGPYQNYLTPEQHIPETGLPYPWETCMTMGNSWSYVPGDIYKPAKVIIENLVDIVSKGGNYLLNIGPGPDGDFDPVAYQRLKEIGAWMKINGEGIYGTRMFNVFGENGIHFTQSKDKKTQFIFLSGFPHNKIVVTKMLFPKNAKVEMLGSDKKVSWKRTEQGIEIAVPPFLKKVSNYVWVLKVKE